MSLRRGVGLIFHQLRGVPGWSSVKVLDVALIGEKAIGKRLFCLFDKELPYKVEIEYFETLKIASPTFVTQNIGLTTQECYLKFLVTARYKSEKEALEELSEIERKQMILSEYQKGHR